jgi:hypothetical protein
MEIPDQDRNALKRLAAGLLLAALIGWGAPPVVDRVDTTAFLQIEANSFTELSPKQQALAWWLSRASIAIDPIIYDQLSRFGLRQKRVLEAVVASREKVDAAIYAKVLDYTKLFWATGATTTK